MGMNAIKYCLSILLIFFFFRLFSQPAGNELRMTDSLKTIIKETKNDSVRINALFAWDNIAYYSDPSLDLKINEEIEALCRSKISEARGKEKEFYDNSLGRALNNIGLCYYIQGNYGVAVDYFTQSIRIQERIGDKRGAGNSLNNIGLIYDLQGDREKALAYHQRSLKLREEAKDTAGIANSLLNIGTIHSLNGNNTSAISYYQRALKIHSRQNDKKGVAMALLNIGTALKLMKDYASARDYFDRSFLLNREMEDEEGMASAMSSLGELHNEKGEYDKARGLLEAALKIAKKNNLFIETRTISNSLYLTYKALGNYKEALEAHKLFALMNDSLNSENARNEVVRQEYKYEYEKKSLADSVLATEQKKVIAAQLRQAHTQRNVLYGGIILLLIIAGFIVNRSRITRRQKALIELQKETVEEKQKEIMDSIRYAKRIQQSLLPSEAFIAKHIKRLKK
jgi:tetratricopeptide (TPR) repeat protein